MADREAYNYNNSRSCVMRSNRELDSKGIQKLPRKIEKPRWLFIVPVISGVLLTLLMMSGFVGWWAENVSDSTFFVRAIEDGHFSIIVHFVLSFMFGIFVFLYIMIYIVSRHKVERTVSFFSYIANDFYADFNTLGTSISAEDRMFYESEQKMRRDKMQDINISEHIDQMKQNEDQKSKINLEAFNASGEETDRQRDTFCPNFDLPDFDPDGPDPFSK